MCKASVSALSRDGAAITEQITQTTGQAKLRGDRQVAKELNEVWAMDFLHVSGDR